MLYILTCIQGVPFMKIGGYLIKVGGQGRGFICLIIYVIGEVELPAFCCVTGRNLVGSLLKRKRLCI